MRGRGGGGWLWGGVKHVTKKNWKKNELKLKFVGINSRTRRKIKMSRAEKVAQVAQNFAQHFIPATFSDRDNI